jgi:hypothetical protein
LLPIIGAECPFDLAFIKAEGGSPCFRKTSTSPMWLEGELISLNHMHVYSFLNKSHGEYYLKIDG